MTSNAEISEQMARLVHTLPGPKGLPYEKAQGGYFSALAGFTVAEIEEAITRYLAAEFPKISLKFYPRAPELAHICRTIRGEKATERERLFRAERQEQERVELREAEKLAVKTPEQKARAAEIMRGFYESLDNSRAQAAAERLERERAETRAKYGMTDEVLAGVKDRPLPRGMKQLGYLMPGIPEPSAPALPKPKPKPDDYGGLP